MGYDKRPGGFGGGSRGGFNKGGGKGGFGDKKEMFQATCATCSKPCEVPFRPTGERPVYCRDCFRNMRDESPTHMMGDRDNAPRSYQNKPAFQPAKPAAPANDRRIDDLKKQIEVLSSKLDSVLSLLRPSAPVAAVPKVETAAPVKAAKVAKKKAAAKKK